MGMTAPIAAMLARIRNACGSKHRRVDIPASKRTLEIARLLKENHFITDFKTVENDEGRPMLRVVLKYAQGGQPVIRELKRVSSPGLRKYVGSTEIPRVRNGLGVAILSTSQGLRTDREARAQPPGAEPPRPTAEGEPRPCRPSPELRRRRVASSAPASPRASLSSSS